MARLWPLPLRFTPGRRSLAANSAQPIGYYNLGCLYSNERRPA